MKVLLLVLAAVLLMPQTNSSETKQVEAVIRDYIEGYYTGNEDRVRSALSSELAKRVVAKGPDGVERLRPLTHEQMAERTKAQQTQKSYPESRRKLEITVFEVRGNIATAKAVAEGWVDYIHLCKLNGRWTIVNVVWN